MPLYPPRLQMGRGIGQSAGSRRSRGAARSGAASDDPCAVASTGRDGMCGEDAVRPALCEWRPVME